MSLTTKDVQHVAELARLKLSDDEVDLYKSQLSEIIEYAARLQSINTSDISPTARIISTKSKLRDDISRPGLRPEELMMNAPETEEGQFRVPPVLD